jgi:hypothetical protein
MVIAAGAVVLEPETSENPDQFAALDERENRAHVPP